MEENPFPEVPPEVSNSHLKKFREIDQLKELKLNYYEDRYNFYIEELRKKEGVGVPMKMNMDRLVVNKVGSQVMDDVLTGRCHHIDFQDFMKHRKRAKRSEFDMYQEFY